MPTLMLAVRAARELGAGPLLFYLLYQAGLRSGWYRMRVRPPTPGPPLSLRLPRLQPLPAAPLTLADHQSLVALLAGETVTFGSTRQRLDFSLPGPLVHWTASSETGPDGRDIKLLWEPARFCWTSLLVRAAAAAPDPRLQPFYHAQLAAFMALHPPYQGLHWANGQEVAIRLMHLVLGAAVLGAPPRFDTVVALHAARLPPTLAYARAQNNNHLLSETAGLVTAGLVLPDHPQAGGWLDRGWRGFERALLDQIAPDGLYMQQSVNYHRLMLQLSLWVARLGSEHGLQFSPAVLARLAAASRWLLARTDPDTGAAPNLGPNDGAYLLPLTSLPYSDHRPVLQAAARAFLGSPAFEPGPWDDLGAWLVPPGPVPEAAGGPAQSGILAHPHLPARACIRAVRFSHRPGHADQLHVDLWWQGANIALDPGTFQYNAAPPWDNPLRTAFHHNTLTVDGRDQMTSAGRFLYVDRAQAQVLESDSRTCTAEHDGYRRLGITHRRTVRAVPQGWLVADRVLGSGRHRIRLHWLLPDWPWELDGLSLRLTAPPRVIGLAVTVPHGLAAQAALHRAGAALAGGPAAPTWGWFSPTYAEKVPALSFSVTLEGALPIELESIWTLTPG